MTTFIQRRHTIAAVLCAGSVLAGSACSSGATADSSSAAQPSVQMDSALHDALPQRIRDAGKLVIVMPGVNPPWWQKAGDSYSGAAAELTGQLGEVLGINVEYVPMNDLAGAFAAVSSGRYDAGFNPYGDTGKSENIQLVDVVREIVPFLVPKGNPKGVNGLDDVCGISVSALGPAGTGSAYKILTDRSDRCVAEGKSAINVVGLKSVPDGVLSVKSGRADAFFASGAPLSYYAKTSDGALEITGKDADNGFSNLYQGMILPLNSPLTPTILAGFQKVFDSGAYDEIMNRYELQAQMLDAPGVDLARAK
ncbi:MULTISPECIES: transporter substrate-binding domain-containing protein [Rhodococcus]|uniref:Transporter substrate-binding domain-containing protein n=1 Tax=Rhodococcus erythropolis TaxID=1833 RepID=A0AAX3ZXM2_RHOER|nr:MULTISPECIES: transporter substrate-binding domain-containing protein [Rhodococcus]OXM20765.1 hypothetical protein CBI33_17465 [Rhodococcus erythropolis]WMN01812.1 transporter substrate-binding domain-containing protein [Rhodococcus erythropolis]